MQLNSVSLMEANLLILSKRPEAKIRRHLQLGLMTFERKILGTSSMNVDDFSPRGSDRGKRDQHFSKKAVAPDNGGWKVATRERDGKKYYWHEATRQTSWVKPAGFIGEDMSVSMSMSMSMTSRSRESSSDSDSDESDSTESLEYSDEGGGGFSPNMNQKTLRNEQEHIHRDRTTSMQLLDVKVAWPRNHIASPVFGFRTRVVVMTGHGPAHFLFCESNTPNFCPRGCGRGFVTPPPTTHSKCRTRIGGERESPEQARGEGAGGL